jgi:hypothetical protein
MARTSQHRTQRGDLADLVHELLYLCVQATPIECMADVADAVRDQSQGGKAALVINLATRIARQGQNPANFLADLAGDISRAAQQEAR